MPFLETHRMARTRILTWSEWRAFEIDGVQLGITWTSLRQVPSPEQGTSHRMMGYFLDSDLGIGYLDASTLEYLTTESILALSRRSSLSSSLLLGSSLPNTPDRCTASRRDSSRLAFTSLARTRPPPGATISEACRVLDPGEAQTSRTRIVCRRRSPSNAPIASRSHTGSMLPSSCRAIVPSRVWSFRNSLSSGQARLREALSRAHSHRDRGTAW
mmetsp:Transcript_22444/g.62510  ORF Transcript_22444/g.62510 Transcript_22444/m.62510 type:complete len:215 (+) Transcript_22444:742-1386(+)